MLQGQSWTESAIEHQMECPYWLLGKIRWWFSVICICSVVSLKIDTVDKKIVLTSSSIWLNFVSLLRYQIAFFITLISKFIAEYSNFCCGNYVLEYVAILLIWYLEFHWYVFSFQIIFHSQTALIFEFYLLINHMIVVCICKLKLSFHF